MEKLTKLLKTLDDNLIKFFVALFIFFIPLYPKFPLKPVAYSNIYIRLDDVFTALIIGVFIIQLFRKKVEINKKFLKYFCFFWIAIVLSYISGLFLTKTIEFPQVGLLHTLRRFQYMIIFFIAASSIKSFKDFKIQIYALFWSIFIITLYGLGQKFFGFPAVQTMNPEFARGHLLFLTPEARLSSTFAGHYDLAAFLVFTIPLLTGAILSSKKNTKSTNFFLILNLLLSIIVLVFTASRSSFIAYILAVTAFMFIAKKPKFWAFLMIVTISFMFLDKEMVKRFNRTFQVKQIFINEKTGQAFIPQKPGSMDLPAGSVYVTLNDDKQTQEDQKVLEEKIAAIRFQIKEEATRSGKILSATEEAAIIATLSASSKPVSSVVYDISFTTRLQVEWPRAIKAFLKNPILGTGASSITESTDNDFLRWIGEFGLAGFCSFLYLIFLINKLIYDAIAKINENKKPLFYGYIFGTLGLLINASYIDVFEASKVAYSFWWITGIYIGLLTINNINTEINKNEKNNKK